MADNIDMKGLPQGFSDEIMGQLGPDLSTRLLTALDTPPDVSVRLNVRKSAPEPIFGDAECVPWCASGFYLSSRPRFTLDPLLHAGAYYVQDASSMVYQNIVAALSDGSPLTVADLCAAPGGKTTAILNALPDGSTLLSNEFVAPRAKVLKENLCKYGYPSVVVTNTDVARLAPLGAVFDLVAVDAPCSGEGMMRKEDMARTQWSTGLVAQCAALQRNILADSVKLVKPGGYLIYSTCTFNTVENEDNAAWISENLGMQPVDIGLSGFYGILPEVKGTVPCLRFMPGFTRGEGLFVTVFRKEEGIDSASVRRKDRSGKKMSKKGDMPKIDKAILAKATEWIHGDCVARAFEDRILAYSSGVEQIVNEMPKDVRIISSGLELAEVKGRDLIPAHPLAMSVAFAHPFPEVELSPEDAISYLMREPVELPADTPKGFVTVTHRGLPLGFLKNLGLRSNNLYPPSIRILHR